MQNKDESRNYCCTECNSIVTARWFSPGSFEIGCDCLTIPVVPQIGQHETPDKWRVQRNICCRNKNVTNLMVCYEEQADYMCGKCNSKYTWKGELVEQPEITNNSNLNEKQSNL